MSAARRPAADTDAVAVRRGRSSPTYTDVHDWVMYSGATPTSIALYAILRSHVNRQRGDDAVWTSTLTLSVLLKLSRGDKVKPYLDELAALGAIAINRGGLHRKNEYVVHALPPDDYAGPASGPDWYARNKQMLARRREHDKAVRDTRRNLARKGKAVGATLVSSGDEPVTPSGGEQESGPVTPAGGLQVTLSTGVPVTLSTGREPNEVELDEKEQPSPSECATHDAFKPGPEEREDLSTNDHTLDPAAGAGPAPDVAVLREGYRRVCSLRPDWNPEDVFAVMSAAWAKGAGYPALTVATEMIECCQDPETGQPSRLTAGGWLTGYRGKSKPDTAAAPSVAGRPRCMAGPAHAPYDRDGCPVCKLEQAEQEGRYEEFAPIPEHAQGLSGAALARAMAPHRRVPLRRHEPKPAALDAGHEPKSFGQAIAAMAEAIGVDA